MFKDHEKSDYMDAFRYLMADSAGQILIRGQSGDPVWADPIDIFIKGEKIIYEVEWPFVPDINLNLEKSMKCECGNKQNPVGQGHSHWCRMFKQEF